MAKLSKETIAAAKRYGHTVDDVAAQYGISGAALLAKVVSGESGDDPDAVSSAGARGRAQFMPGSRDVAVQKYGVDPWSHDADQAVHAAALHLRGLINGSKGLQGYNPGSPTYTSYILGQKVGNVSGGTKVKRPSTAAPTPQSSYTPQAATPAVPGVDNSGLRRQLVGQFLAQGGVKNSSAVLGLAAQYGQAADVPGTAATYAQPVKASAQGSTSSRTSASSKVKMPSGTATFEGHTVAAWIKPALAYARKHGWEGTVNSGYRSFADQTRIYNSGVRPAAKPGTSNHEGSEYPRGAVDVSDAQTLSRILARSPYARQLQWAGAKDPPHFSHPHNGSY